ncbi:MAG: hypothetical protein H6550_14635 [Chitinophagales bacterium]|nr:hypothetical protein [Chitinophagales bacterium]
MSKSITRTWLVINLVLVIYYIYMAFTAGFDNKTTTLLLAICSISNTVYLMYKMGIFKKGALRPDAESRKNEN